MKRRTVQRESILQAFKKQNRPLTIQEALEEADKSNPGLGVATVYRNINRMVEEGILRSVELLDNVSRYELSGLTHHHHFHCDVCDKVFDFHSCLENIETLAPNGFVVKTHEIILNGICSACQ